MRAGARRHLSRALLVVLGLLLVGALARSAGVGRIASVLRDASPWLPVIVALEAVPAVIEVLVLRGLLRDAGHVPPATWVRSSAAAYAMMIALPAGRAAGEVARAALVAEHVGPVRAVTAGTQLQAAYLFANGAMSACASVAIGRWARASSPLALALAANALLMWALAAGVLVLLRGDRAGRWLERLRSRFLARAAPSPSFEPGARRAIPWAGAALCTASRGVQVLQYAVLVRAVGGVASAQNALIAEGIHLVGATVGDVLPNQLGALDAAYRAFAGSLGFSGAPARALSIALLVHGEQLACAAACVVIAAVTGRASSLREALPAAGCQPGGRAR